MINSWPRSVWSTGAGKAGGAHVDAPHSKRDTLSDTPSTATRASNSTRVTVHVLVLSGFASTWFR